MNDFSIQLSNILDQIIGSVSSFQAELVIIVAFLASIISSLFVDKLWKHSSFTISIIGIIISACCVSFQIDRPTDGFFGMLIIDNFSVYARFIIAFGVLISFIFIQQHYKEKIINKRIGDIYSILLAAMLGLNILTITSNWLMIFIAIETVSISSYVLVGYFSETKKQSEAAMKYVLFGSVSAAIMLYGLSLIYGFTGNLDFNSQDHLLGLIDSPRILTAIAVLFVLAGIGFKLSFVPFHLWSPDVYEGAPTPVTAFLSTVPKIGVIVVLSRLFQSWSSTSFFFSDLIVFVVTGIAIVTMLVGNLIALRQSNAKRMMAYSSIGHTGFLLMAVIPNMDNEPQVLLFYMTVYTIMNLAVFAFIDVIEQKTGSAELKTYIGLGKKNALIFTAFTIVGISLVGLPPTGGFVGKLLVFTSVFEIYQEGQDYIMLILLIAGALTSVISLFYYFKIPLFSFLRKNDNSDSIEIPFGIVGIIGLILASIAFILGIFPSIVLTLFK